MLFDQDYFFFYFDDYFNRIAKWVPPFTWIEKIFRTIEIMFNVNLGEYYPVHFPLLFYTLHGLKKKIDNKIQRH